MKMSKISSRKNIKILMIVISAGSLTSMYILNAALQSTFFEDVGREFHQLKQLKEPDTLGKFSAIFTRETTFATSCLPFCAHQAHSDKAVYSIRKECVPLQSTLKGKNLLPRSKFFPFRVDHFSERRQNNLAGLSSLKVNHFSLKGKEMHLKILDDMAVKTIMTLALSDVILLCLKELGLKWFLRLFISSPHFSTIERHRIN